MKKAEGAFLTISELSAELDVPQHILRYWETRFPALRPLQRAGNRRYYRPDDVLLARRIHHLLSVEGFTVKGAQKALSEGAGSMPPAPVDAAPETLLSQLETVRAMLARALGV
ncbi:MULTISPECIES: MerR family transcriptional regulator [Sphingomonadaceae]|jgi:DNA-binding transcriptional MerR regulator|uniref:MerR family transcriptional regulator n=1 Tax=Sphingobium soli TaxID=1591116 RepID=A0ABS8H5L7_9SPHN|nr:MULTISPECIES: MerR family transcriptional regulator [Sphingomonadaceae]MEC9017755.1 MerR family transcriptional regulator [Pseudomonadota bacterium]EAT09651.1 Predicted transcriptional regulator [Sphingomonas sp. SKA58]MBA37111.1 MerR family transcriptional regulator [Sphingobium sp.]MBS47541.1 MerR family transcriptional regulator [Sphingobium sp.]MBS90660.1 MerR family transcriptional regulator [Sphingobium sp.]|tara:strand:+ start:110 stop:448 length:339 start_codon:yes stop_codon:yes gene_type:complete